MLHAPLALDDSAVFTARCKQLVVNMLHASLALNDDLAVFTARCKHVTCTTAPLALDDSAVFTARCNMLHAPLALDDSAVFTARYKHVWRVMYADWTMCRVLMVNTLPVAPLMASYTYLKLSLKNSCTH